MITGSAILIQAGSDRQVLQALEAFPEVTFHVKSDSGTELVVNLEARDAEALEALCDRLKRAVPSIVDIAHIYVNLEEEVEEALSAAGGRNESTGEGRPS